MRTSASVWIGTSAAGRVVRVECITNEDFGASAYYVVTADNKRARFTPFEARMIAIRDAFLADVVDPARLARSGPVHPPNPESSDPTAPPSDRVRRPRGPRSVFSRTTTPARGGAPGGTTRPHKETDHERRVAFFRAGEESHGLALLDATNAAVDTEVTLAATQQAARVRDDAAAKQSALAAAQRIRDYPRQHLADLQWQAEQATTRRAQVVTDLRTKADTRERAARARYDAAVRAALDRPHGVDPVADQLEQQDLRRRLEGLDPAERTGMLTAAARDNTHRPLLRAALTAPTGPWTTTTWPALVDAATATRLRDLLAARVDPSLVEDVWVIRRLRKTAEALSLAEWQPAAPAAPTLRAGPGGVKILDA